MRHNPLKENARPMIASAKPMQWYKKNDTVGMLIQQTWDDRVHRQWIVEGIKMSDPSLRAGYQLVPRKCVTATSFAGEVVRVVHNRNNIHVVAYRDPFSITYYNTEEDIIRCLVKNL